MIEEKRTMKQLGIKDVQTNFEQVLNDVLLNSEHLKITRDEGEAILVSSEFSLL